MYRQTKNEKAPRRAGVWLALLLTAGLCGCGSGQAREAADAPETPQEADAARDTDAPALADGVYTAEFHTDSSMFHVSEACDGKGTLTVRDGQMTIHVSLASKNILNLYPGLAKDAGQDGAALLEPTVDTVTYSDGMTEEVNGFTIPVPALDAEFDLALIGTKGVWYDHKVYVTAPVPETGGGAAQEDGQAADGGTTGQSGLPGKSGTPGQDGTSGQSGIPENGVYLAEVTLEGGSGKAAVSSPAELTVADGVMTARIAWNSPNYDYMIVDGERYLPEAEEDNAVFVIPVSALDQPLSVIADTVAMSRPHEIEYRLTFRSDTLRPAQEGAEAAGLKRTGGMRLQYAEGFSVDYYEGGYTMLTTKADGARFLLVPEGKEAPRGLAEDVAVLCRPVHGLYLVASSAMDLFCALDGLDAISFSGQKADGWYIAEAKAAMENGAIRYAGKYDRPDYEQIVSGGCTLAIENTMISHAPEVMEKLEDFGIPVLIDYASREPHPLGRAEWVRFYGALLGKEDAAARIFQEQTETFDRVQAEEKTGKRVAFFFLTSNGMVQVRQSADYIPKIIELAGGSYAFPDLGDPDSARSTTNLQVEEFYAGAKDADFLIYNSSIDGGVSGVDELLEKCPPLADFRAVREGNVWCTSADLYQQPLSAGALLEEIHAMLTGETEAMDYLIPLR